MGSKLLTTDAEIINGYTNRYRVTDAGEDRYKEVKELKDIICPEKRAIWDRIIDGLLHSVNGDGELKNNGVKTWVSYDNPEEYREAYKIFDSVSKDISDKNSLLFLFVEIRKIDTRAFSQKERHKEDLVEICKQYDEVIKNFKNSEDDDIKNQVATAIHLKGVALGEYHQPNKDKELYKKAILMIDDLLDKFKDNKSQQIQNTIVIASNNRADNIECFCEIYNKEREEIWDAIIEKYKDTDNGVIKNEVASAMYNKALSLYMAHIIQQAKKTSGFIVEQENNWAEQALKAYDNFINCYEESSFPSVQKCIIHSMENKIKILNEMDDKLLQSYNEPIKVLSDNNYNRFSSQVKEVNSKINKLNHRLAVNRSMRELCEFYPDNEKNIKKVIDLIKKCKMIPFIGAGMSKFAGYPLWTGLLDDIYEKYSKYDKRKRLMEISEDFKKASCTKKATMLKKELGQAFFSREIRAAFSVENRVTNDIINQPIYMLPQLFEQFILTTNFDTLIEQVYSLNDRYVVQCSASDYDKLNDIDGNATVLYKLHGTIDEPNNIILTAEDYKEHYKKDSKHYITLYRYLTGRSLLFLGCSLIEDEEITPFYGTNLNYAISHCEEGEIEDVERNLSNKYIIPILFPKNKFSYINDILQYIIRCRENASEATFN